MGQNSIAKKKKVVMTDEERYQKTKETRKANTVQEGFKAHKLYFFITLIITLLPIVIGLALNSKLPDELPLHFNLQGETDNMAPKAFIIYGMPLIMAASHFICVALALGDRGNKDPNKATKTLIFWICPVLSNLLCILVFMVGLGYDFNVTFVVSLLVAILFEVLGVLMMFSKQGSSVGFRNPWTMGSKRNWKATHIFSGILWMVSGVLIAICSIIGKLWIWIIVLIIQILAPSYFSHWYYKKQFGGVPSTKRHQTGLVYHVGKPRIYKQKKRK